MTTTDNKLQPRRAIIYIVWGFDYLQTSIASAQSTAFMQIPVILMTDTATAALLPPNNPFSEIQIIEFEEYGFFAKMQVFENLPAAYDSFLVLDADTIVLKDVTFGFEMAERHGIAVATNPIYTLEHYRGFGRVMKHFGVKLNGQYCYNCGVIFVSRRPDVMKVLRAYKEFGYRAAEEIQYARADQPFFSLALEYLQFNPYSLPPTYSYRAKLAEPICGDVRIWHQHCPVPSDVNDYISHKNPRPRGYINGKRINDLQAHAKIPEIFGECWQRIQFMQNMLRKLKRKISRKLNLR